MADGLHLETMETVTLELLRQLMADNRLEPFNLVGGTALALQLGHRKSVDLDLFRTTEFDSGQLAEHLKQQYNADHPRQNKNGVFGYIGGVKFDMLTDPTPLIDNLEKIEGIRMLSIRDIGAMKMNAIYDDGGRLKDFADMYALLEKHPFNTYLDYALQKFPEINPVMLRKSLLYHADVKFEKKVEYVGKPVEWSQIVDRLREAYHNPAKTFEESNKLKNAQWINKTPRMRRGHRPG
jgi:hypothetical protein